MATATCRPGSSPADAFRSTRAAPLAAALALAAAPAGAGGLELELGRLAHPSFALEGVRVEVGSEGGPARLAIARLVVGERKWKDLALRCPDFRLAEGTLRCRGGSLSVPGLVERAAVNAEFDVSSKTGHVSLLTPAGERIHVVAKRDGQLRMALAGIDLSRLVRWLPELAEWQAGGRFDGRIDFRPAPSGGRIVLSGRVTDAGFASADGLHAAERMTLGVDLRATAHGGQWRWQGGVAWTAGEAYLHPLYLTAGPAGEAAGEFGGSRLRVDRATLSLEGVRSVTANGVYDVAGGRLVRAALSMSDADLATLGPRWLAPLLMPARADALQFGGRMSAGIVVDETGPAAIDVAFDEASFGLATGDLAFGPVSGSLPWRADAPTSARITVAGGHWQKLALGPFELDARLHGERLAIDRVAVPVLDGALVLHGIALERGARGWRGSGAAVVEPISMNRLTEAVGLPAMTGTLAASLPGLRVAPGELALDGALVISVFDGYVQATGLRVLEPFGVAAHLYADIEARRLDLAQLTDTFSFGSITGFVDADVRGLELARWRPVRFDARVASSPGDYRRRISQRAVQNISALGGAGAVAALQRSFLGFFDTFGYREIGLSCRLEGGVCRMDGLEGGRTPGDGFRIVSGGGVPALNVIGYNRRVDWNELIDRLQRVISANTAPVVR